jgi:hypothetical protein
MDDGAAYQDHLFACGRDGQRRRLPSVLHAKGPAVGDAIPLCDPLVVRGPDVGIALPSAGDALLGRIEAHKVWEGWPTPDIVFGIDLVKGIQVALEPGLLTCPLDLGLELFK